MPRPRPRTPEEPDDETGDELVESDEDGSEETDEPPRSGARSSGRPPAIPPIRDWSLSEDGSERRTDWRGRPKKPVYWRARDSLWFEPLIAIAIVVLLIVGLWAYTQNWPPIYVVESSSMQHGTTDGLGLINTGDLVLAQKIDASQVTPYVVGLQDGHSTYGEPGDVLLYYPGGDTGVTPIIHRSIIYLVYDANRSWSAPELAPLACSTTTHLGYAVEYGGRLHCNPIYIPNSATVWLYHIGWQSVDVPIPVSELNPVSGFLTMGDNNIDPGNNQGEPDQFSIISPGGLVQPSWILGVARGMIPWVGAVKLLLEGDASMVPPQSWDYLLITVAAVVLGGLGLHLLFRGRGDYGDDDEGDGEEPPRPGLGARLAGLFHRRPPNDDAGDDDSAPPAKPGKTIPKHKLLPKTKGGGRPRPAVRSRSRASKRSKAATSDADREL